MAKQKIPLDIIGQEIIPGDLVVVIQSKGRGSKSNIEVVTGIMSKSIVYNNNSMERSVKCLKITEEQAMNHNILNYDNPSNREIRVENKIKISRELKEKFNR